MPITAYTTILGDIVMFGSWLLIGQRIKANPLGASAQVRYLHRFFLSMGIFFLLMFLPDLLIPLAPLQFPLAMAWGYVIGHIFLYIALAYVARTFFSMVPRLASKDRVMLVITGLFCTAITIVNTLDMPFGRRPVFDAAHNVIEYNASTAVGLGIAVFAAVCVFPTAVLMIVNGIRNPNARVRSFLLGAGLFVIMSAGPLHDNARTSTLYAVADFVSMLGLLLIAGGVLYRFSERIVASKAAAQPSRPSFQVPGGISS